MSGDLYPRSLGTAWKTIASDCALHSGGATSGVTDSSRMFSATVQRDPQSTGVYLSARILLDTRCWCIGARMT